MPHLRPHFHTPPMIQPFSGSPSHWPCGAPRSRRFVESHSPGGVLLVQRAYRGGQDRARESTRSGILRRRKGVQKRRIQYYSFTRVMVIVMPLFVSSASHSALSPPPPFKSSGDDSPRHVGVHGVLRREPLNRPSPRLRGLRGRRAADRSGAEAPPRRAPIGRNRESPPRRLQCEPIGGKECVHACLPHVWVCTL